MSLYIVFFVMVYHHGRSVELVLRRSNKSMIKIAKELGITRKTLYSNFAKQSLSRDFLEKIGKVVDFDFESLFLGDNEVLSISEFYGSKFKYVNLKNSPTMLVIMMERIFIDYGDTLIMLLELVTKDISEKLKKDIYDFIIVLERYQKNKCFSINMKEY